MISRDRNRPLIAALISLCSVCALGAEPVPDGLYLHAPGEPAPPIRTQDGREFFLGARRDLKILGSDLLANDNANSQFQLQLTTPYDPTLVPGTYLLIVAGTAYRQGGSGASQQESSSLTFQILEEDNARQVARYFNIPIAYRRHPGHELRVTFTPTKQSFASGSEVTAVLRITNMGTKSIAFMKGGRNRAPRDNQYIFSAHRYDEPVPEIGTSRHFGGLASKYVLQPAATFEDTISLSKWFAFDMTGFYDIHGSYFMRFIDPEADSWGTVWTDYVSADFMVKID